MADDDGPDPLDQFRGEVTARLDQLGAAVDEIQKARTTPQRREAQRDAGEARDDLDAVLRKHGYRLSRDDLDELAEQREYESFRKRMQRFVDEQKAGGSGSSDDDDDSGGKGKGKRKAKAGASKGGDDDAPPENRGGWLRM